MVIIEESDDTNYHPDGTCVPMNVYIQKIIL